MSINDLPVLSALRTKMQWHQERQRVLSENVSNSDTPNFRPRELVEPKFDKTGAAAGSMGPLAMAVTSASHMTPENKGVYTLRPSTSTSSLSEKRLLKPRMLTIHLFASI